MVSLTSVNPGLQGLRGGPEQRSNAPLPPPGIAAIGQINEALQEGDSMKTLAMLQNPAAKLSDVDPSVAQHYHDKLLEARREKAHVRRRWLPAPRFVYPLVTAPL